MTLTLDPPILEPIRPGQPVDDGTRREFLAGGAALAVLGLAACGGDDASAGGATRTIRHAAGTTEVPDVPRRIVGLNDYPIDALEVVGMKPVGIPMPSALPKYLRDGLDGVQVFGTVEEPNLERIGALEPDLILGAAGDSAQLYEELSRIAPTVLADVEDSSDWRAGAAKYFEALGRKEEGDRAISKYEHRVEEFGAPTTGRLAQTTVSILNPRPDGFRVYGKHYFGGTILEEVGLSRPPAQQVEEQEPLDFSSEQLLQKADADAIFVWTFGEEGVAALAELREEPLYPRLEAVAEGEVYKVGSHWIGYGYVAADLVLDDLFEQLGRAR